MGLPEILIEFKAKAETAVARSQNGILAVILEARAMFIEPLRILIQVIGQPKADGI